MYEIQFDLRLVSYTIHAREYLGRVAIGENSESGKEIESKYTFVCLFLVS